MPWRAVRYSWVEKSREPGKVLYFLGEEFVGDVLQRIDALLRGRGLTIDDLGVQLSLAEEVPCLELLGDQGDLGLAVRDEKPALVIFDPLERFLSQGDTNNSKDMRSVNNFIREFLSRKLGASVCVVHHTDKKGNGLRGTGDFRAVSEVTLLLGEPKDGRVRVGCEMRGARAPQLNSIKLLDLPSGAVRWAQGAEAAPDLDREPRALELLQQAGTAGVTSAVVQKDLKMRAADVEPLMHAVGAVRTSSRGPWVLAAPAEDQAA